MAINVYQNERNIYRDKLVIIVYQTEINIYRDSMVIISYQTNCPPFQAFSSRGRGVSSVVERLSLVERSWVRFPVGAWPVTSCIVRKVNASYV